MAVRIRLRRMGAKRRPFYRLVVADSRSARNGRVIEWLGTYDPTVKPAHINIDVERAQYWIDNGAQPSDTAKRLLSQAQETANESAPAEEATEAGAEEEKEEEEVAEPVAE